MNEGQHMEFKGAVKISRSKVDNACVNFKKIHNEMMKLIREKKEELKTITTPVYFLGIKIPHLESTKYKDLGFNGSYIERYYALKSMVKEMLANLPECHVSNLLEIYNTDSFSNLINCYHQLEDLRRMETGGVIINPQQAKFVHDYYNIHREG